MNIAIIGAGFAGLATGWFLTELGCRITFYDVNSIGKGASGCAAGLLHPYVGEQTKRSLWADEAIAATKALLLAAQPQAILEEGIIRIAQSQSQREALNGYDDVESLGEDRFLICSGIVVDSALYLQGLFQGCLAKGATFEKKEIADLGELSDFTEVVIAAGHQIDRLLPQFQSCFSKIKGQILRVHLAEKKIRSLIAKGYLARSAQEGIYHWGSTYEHNYTNEEPDLAMALSLLQKNEFPFPGQPDILDCRAGVRLARQGHYMPFVDQIKKGLWCFGALGSRGLLYHALLGKKLAEAIIRGNRDLIPKECRARKNEIPRP